MIEEVEDAQDFPCEHCGKMKCEDAGVWLSTPFAHFFCSSKCADTWVGDDKARQDFNSNEEYEEWLKRIK